MKKYVFTKDTLIGNVIFGYNPAGLLVYYDASPAQPTEAQLIVLLKGLPREEQELQQLADKTNGTIRLLMEDISFESFWEKYGRKIKRLRAEPMFKKLSDANKLQAIIGIAAYDAYLEKTNFRGKVDADNYLRHEYYLVDWKKEK
jgi:hypothetical protein